MITINNIECGEGSASLDRSGYLYKWRGEASFLVPQKTVAPGRSRYLGPLFGYNAAPIDISGDIYIISAKVNDEKLFKSVEFVGSGPPVDAKGGRLSVQTVPRFNMGLDLSPDKYIEVCKAKAVESVYQILKTSPRVGTGKDKPEGSRYIIISDTLAQEMMKKLELWRKQ